MNLLEELNQIIWTFLVKISKRVISCVMRKSFIEELCRYAWYIISCSRGFLHVLPHRSQLDISSNCLSSWHVFSMKLYSIIFNILSLQIHRYRVFCVKFYNDILLRNHLSVFFQIRATKLYVLYLFPKQLYLHLRGSTFKKKSRFFYYLLCLQYF